MEKIHARQIPNTPLDLVNKETDDWRKAYRKTHAPEFSPWPTFLLAKYDELWNFACLPKLEKKKKWQKQQ
jgi:hypothetical protein